MNKVGVKVGIMIYVLIAILISIYLVSYNKFGFSEMGRYTFFVASDMETYKDGSFVISNKKINDLEKNDKIIFYDSYNATSKILEGRVVSSIITNEKETTILLENDLYLSSSYLISRVADTTEIPLVGYLIAFLSSWIGYLIFVIFPITLILIFEFKILFNNLNERKDKENVDENTRK